VQLQESLQARLQQLRQELTQTIRVRNEMTNQALRLEGAVAMLEETLRDMQQLTAVDDNGHVGD
jgi:hypothetical protein